MIRYYIQGTWEHWRPFPYSNERYKIQGELDVHGDGRATLKIQSDDNRVRADPMPITCPILPVPITPVPITKPTGHFSLSVFFPIGVSKVSTDNAQRIRKWAYCLPSQLRDKMAAGEIAVYIEGYASRPGGVDRNQKLSSQRASNVMSVLAGPIGLSPPAKFIHQFHGNNLQNLPGLKVMEWVRRALNPKKYDQAAVIHFEADGIDDNQLLKIRQCQQNL